MYVYMYIYIYSIRNAYNNNSMYIHLGNRPKLANDDNVGLETKSLVDKF